MKTPKNNSEDQQAPRRLARRDTIAVDVAEQCDRFLGNQALKWSHFATLLKEMSAFRLMDGPVLPR